ncbi:cytochrome P450 81C13-like [Coffea arabica]|uniref:Cytochrome P450 81C13-like n=2 Tax=Coffea TaxID=13442 RepID=A0ABM4W1B2_COFAR
MENLCYYLVTVLLCSLPLLLISKSLLFNHVKNKKLPPSPLALPIIGHLYLIKNSLYEDLTSLSSRYGPIFFLQFGRRSFVVVSSPSAIEECFTRNDIILANRPRGMAGDRFSYNYTVVGIAPYGHLWRVLRRLLVVESFSFNSLQRTSFIREEEIKMILRSIYRISKNGSLIRVDLNHWISVFTLNVIMRMLVGRCSIREEDAGEELGMQIIKEFREMFASGIALSLCDFFPILRWIGYKGLEKEMISLHKKRDKLFQGFIDEFQCSDTLLDKDKKALIANLLACKEKESDFLSDDIIKGIALIMLTAGRETSTLTTEWAMLLLLNHPKALQKLRTEIDNSVGHGRLVDESDIPKLPYLRCVVNETLRLYPAAPLLIPHHASEDCRVGGYDIPKGTIVLANAWAVHRDPKLWEEPEKFMPERFEGKGLMDKEEFNSKFLPFGIGRRACPGANLGIRNVSLAVGTFIQCFDWDKVEEDGELDVNFSNRITLKKANHLEAICAPRQESIQLLSQL